MKTRGALVEVLTLTVVAVLCAVAMVITYGNVRYDDQVAYSAMFHDVSGLRADDDVRIAGVTVGTVKSVEVDPQDMVDVKFTVARRNPLLIGSQARIRYKNLIGQRYLELTEGTGPPRQLPANGVIPVTQTFPALDLDELYNGFAPLFDGLAPDQVNQLSGSLISVLQGQSGTVQGLLGSIGSFTASLADKDQVIGELITNLNSVLATVNQHDPQLADLVDQLQQLISGLAADRGPLGDSLTHIDSLTGTVAGLLDDARPALKGDIEQTRRVSSLINSDTDSLNTLFQHLPGYYQLLGRVGIYQQGFQFYLCGVQLKVGPVMSDVIASQEARCQY
jgi:phospholipid/cholesterol/gamma-HCH transport system substrate-binding protein